VPVDAGSETQRSPQRQRPQPSGERRNSFPGRWWKRWLLAIGIAAAVVSFAALSLGVIRSGETGPKLTHTITRGDLIVSVTQHGTLESSENTEIKCKVRGGEIPIIWVIESGTVVDPGDELVRLGTLEFEDRVHEVSRWVHMTRSAAERSQADVVNAKLAVSEYLEGRYRSQLMTLEKDLAIAESHLRTAQNMLDHAEMMAERGYASELEVEEKTFAVTRAALNVEVKSTEIRVLKEYTKKMQLETLNGNVKASKANHEANTARAKQLAEQLPLCLADVDYCVVKAERSGLVVYPTAEPWKRVPDIEEGAKVYMGQTMLLMPDLSKMQVKVGVDESIVDRVKPGLAAKVSLAGMTIDAEVSSVASVTAPAGWWNGNQALYDTVVKLPSVEGLKPAMSAEVEVIIDRHEDVLTIPVAAVVETAGGDFCWVKTSDKTGKRSLVLGDTNDRFTVVTSGLREGEKVVLNPFAFQAARALLAKEHDAKKLAKSGSNSPEADPEPKPIDTAPSDGTKKQPTKSKTGKPKKAASISAAQIIQLADKNDDGVLTIDEFAKKNQKQFEMADANQDGQVDASELDAALKRRAKAKPK